MDLSRGKRLQLNTITSLVFQLTTIVCGFILPKLILSRYGSRVNGLVNSVTQFMQFIAFLELGVGAVVQASLYKPLSNKDMIQISRIVRSADKFFKIIARLLLVYTAILVVVYPRIVIEDFEYVYTATLIVTISISSFAQYYFGMVDRLLLSADQRGYIQYLAQTITLILNTVACAVLICIGATIHTVKLTTSILYLIRPIVLRIYVNRHYRLDRKIQYAGEPIKQKWNGIAQHMAAVVLEQTDVIVLTIFATLTDVSVYSVYHMIIYGVKNLMLSLTNGFQSLIGEMIAKEETEKLNSFFRWMEWLLHTGTVLVFGCTCVLIVPFVTVYTKGIADTNYIVPLFAILITLAHAGHCLRLPYNILILAAGHFKQTQWSYIIAALMNVLVSVFTVRIWGLVGVAVGTMCAMMFQTVWMAVYDSRNILNYSMREFTKHIAVDGIVFITAFFITNWIPMTKNSYLSWIGLAAVDLLVWGVVSLLINYVAYKEYTIKMILGVRKVVKKMKKSWGGGTEN